MDFINILFTIYRCVGTCIYIALEIKIIVSKNETTYMQLINRSEQFNFMA